MTIDLTTKLYQNGLSREDAQLRGADMTKFDALEIEYKGCSIPLHILLGFKKTEPYSCNYHTGGKQGAMLRAAIARHNQELEFVQTVK